MDTKTAGISTFCERHRLFIKTVAIVVSFCFIVQEAAFAQGGGQSYDGSSARPAENNINLREFSIPRDIGTTKEIQPFDSKETIINIKDAHDNLSAQQSIVSILDNLVTNYEISTIAIEGSSGYVDTSVISSFPDKEIRTRFAGRLMAEGRISAAEYFSVITESEVALYGVDDQEMHAENMEAFRTSLAHAAVNGKKAAALYDCLAALEERVYSEELKALEENSILKNNGRVGFTKRWDLVRSIGDNCGVAPSGYANIESLLRATALEKKCDFDATNEEREALLGELKTKLDKNRLEELILKSLSFKLGKISASMFYSHMVDAARLAGIDLAKYPNIRLYVEYMTLYESIDIAAIKDEVTDYEARIKEKLYRNSDERELSGLMRKASVLKDLVDLKLTSASLAYYRANRASFSAEEFSDFIRRMYLKYGLQIPSGLDIPGVFDSLAPSEAFYELTLKRNDAIVKNTIERMKKKRQTVAALVTGGFHTQGIAELLKEQRISYLVILPKFDKDKKRPYITLITNKKNDYAGMLSGSGQYIALASYLLDPAFRKACGAELVKLAAESLTQNGKINISKTIFIKALREQLEAFIRAQNKLSAGDKSEELKAEDVAMMEQLINAIIDNLKNVLESNVSKDDLVRAINSAAGMEVTAKPVKPVVEAAKPAAIETGPTNDELRGFVIRFTGIEGSIALELALVLKGVKPASLVDPAEEKEWKKVVDEAEKAGLMKRCKKVDVGSGVTVVYNTDKVDSVILKSRKSYESLIREGINVSEKGIESSQREKIIKAAFEGHESGKDRSGELLGYGTQMVAVEGPAVLAVQVFDSRGGLLLGFAVRDEAEAKKLGEDYTGAIRAITGDSGFYLQHKYNEDVDVRVRDVLAPIQRGSVRVVLTSRSTFNRLRQESGDKKWEGAFAWAAPGLLVLEADESGNAENAIDKIKAYVAAEIAREKAIMATRQALSEAYTEAEIDNILANLPAGVSLDDVRIAARDFRVEAIRREIPEALKRKDFKSAREMFERLEKIGPIKGLIAQSAIDAIGEGISKAIEADKTAAEAVREAAEEKPAQVTPPVIITPRGAGTAHSGIEMSHAELNAMIRALFERIEKALIDGGLTQDDINSRLKENGNFNLKKLSEELRMLNIDTLKDVEILEHVDNDGLKHFVVIADGIASHCGRRSGDIWINRKDGLVKKATELHTLCGFELNEAYIIAYMAFVLHEEVELKQLIVGARVRMGEHGKTAEDAVAWLEDEANISDEDFKTILEFAHMMASQAESEYLASKIQELNQKTGNQNVKAVEVYGGNVMVAPGISSHINSVSGQVWISKADLEAKKEELKEKLAGATDEDIEKIAAEALMVYEVERSNKLRELMLKARDEAIIKDRTKKYEEGGRDVWYRDIRDIPIRNMKKSLNESERFARNEEERVVRIAMKALDNFAKVESGLQKLKDRIASLIRAPTVGPGEGAVNHMPARMKWFESIARLRQRRDRARNADRTRREFEKQNNEKTRQAEKRDIEELEDSWRAVAWRIVIAAKKESNEINGTYNTILNGARDRVKSRINELLEKIDGMKNRIDKFEAYLSEKEESGQKVDEEDKARLKAMKTELEDKDSGMLAQLKCLEGIINDKNSDRLLAEIAVISHIDNQLKAMVASGETQTKQLRLLAACNVNFAMRLHNGRKLRVQQIEGAKALFKRLGINMSTGQGKTATDLAAIYMLSLEANGSPIDIMAKEDSEAERLKREIGTELWFLGLSTGLLTKDQGMVSDCTELDYYEDGKLNEEKKQQELLQRKKESSRANVRFITHQAFFDYMHDRGLAPNRQEAERYLEKMFKFVLIDETDALVLDQAMCELIIAVSKGQMQANEAMPFYLANAIARFLSQNAARHTIIATLDKKGKPKTKEAKKAYDTRTGIWINYDPSNTTATLTEEGKAEVNKIVQNARALIKSMGFEVDSSVDWSRLVTQSLTAVERAGSYFKGRGDLGALEGKLIDEATGFEAAGRKWQDGLDEALQVSLGNYNLHESGGTQAKISVKEVLDHLYDGNWTGLSGTNIEASDEYKSRFGLPVVKILDREKGSLRRISYKNVSQGEEFEEMVRGLIESRGNKEFGLRPLVFMLSRYPDCKRFDRSLRLLIWMARLNIDEYALQSLESEKGLNRKKDILKALFEGNAEAKGWWEATEDSFKLDDLTEVIATFRKLRDGDKHKGENDKKNLDVLQKIDMEKLQSLTADKDILRAEVEKNAGELGMITITTNMMGRASDIKIADITELLERAKEAQMSQKYIALLTVLERKNEKSEEYRSAAEILKDLGILADAEIIASMIIELSDMENSNGLRYNRGENAGREAVIERIREAFGAIEGKWGEVNELRQHVLLRYVHGLQFHAEREELLRTEIQKAGRPARQGMPGEMIFYVVMGKVVVGKGEQADNTREKDVVTRGLRNRPWWSPVNRWAKWRVNRGIKEINRLEVERREFIKKARVAWERGEYGLEMELNARADENFEKIENLKLDIAKMLSKRGSQVEFFQILKDWNNAKAADDKDKMAELELMHQIYFRAAQIAIERQNCDARKSLDRFSTMKHQELLNEMKRAILGSGKRSDSFNNRMRTDEVSSLVDMAFPERMSRYMRPDKESRQKAFKALEKLHNLLADKYGYTFSLSLDDLIDIKRMLESTAGFPSDIRTRKRIVRYVIDVVLAEKGFDENETSAGIDGAFEDFLAGERTIRSRLTWLWRLKMFWRMERISFTDGLLAKAVARHNVKKDLKRAAESKRAAIVDALAAGEGKSSIEYALSLVNEVARSYMKESDRPQIRSGQEELAEAPKQGKHLRVTTMGVTGRGAREAPMQEMTTVPTAITQYKEDRDKVDTHHVVVVGSDGTSRVEHREDVLDAERESFEAAQRAKSDRKVAIEKRKGSLVYDRDRGVCVAPDVETGDPAIVIQALSGAGALPPGSPPLVILTGSAAAYYNSRSSDDERNAFIARVRNASPQVTVLPQNSSRIIVISSPETVKGFGSQGEELEYFRSSGEMVLKNTTIEELREVWDGWVRDGIEPLDALERRFNSIFGKKNGFVTVNGATFFCRSVSEKLDGGTVSLFSVYEAPEDFDPGYGRFMEDLERLVREGAQAFRDNEKSRRTGAGPKAPMPSKASLWNIKQKMAERKIRKSLRDAEAERMKRPDMVLILAKKWFRDLIYSKDPVPIKFNADGSVMVGTRLIHQFNFKRETELKYPEPIMPFELKRGNAWQRFENWLLTREHWNLSWSIPIFIVARIAKSVLWDLWKWLGYTIIYKKVVQRPFLPKAETDEELIRKYYDPGESTGGFQALSDSLGIVLTGQQAGDLRALESDTSESGKSKYYAKFAAILLENAKKITSSDSNRKARLLEKARELAMLAHVLDKNNKDALRALTRISEELKKPDDVIKFGKLLMGFKLRMPNIWIWKVREEADQEALLAMYKACMEKKRSWLKNDIRKKMDYERLREVLDITAPGKKEKGVKAWFKMAYEHTLITKRAVEFVKRHAPGSGTEKTKWLSTKMGYITSGAWVLSKVGEKWGIKQLAVLTPLYVMKWIFIVTAAVAAVDIFVIAPIRMLHEKQLTANDRRPAEKKCPEDFRAVTSLAAHYADEAKGNDIRKARYILGEFLRRLTVWPIFMGTESKRNRAANLIGLATYYLTQHKDETEALAAAERIMKYIDSSFGKRLMAKYDRSDIAKKIDLLRALYELKKKNRETFIGGRTAADVVDQWFRENEPQTEDADILFVLGLALMALKESADQSDKDYLSKLENKLKGVRAKLQELYDGLLPDETTDGDRTIIKDKKDMGPKDVSGKDRETIDHIVDILKALPTTADLQKADHEKAEAARRAVDDGTKPIAVPQEEAKKAQAKEELPVKDILKNIKALKGYPGNDAKLIRMYIDLAEACERERAEAGFWLKLWRFVTFRGYHFRKMRSLVAAVKLSKGSIGLGYSDGGYAAMKLAEALIAEGKGSRLLIKWAGGWLKSRDEVFGSWRVLKSNIEVTKSVIEGFKAKLEAGEKLSDEEKDTLNLALTNLDALTEELLGRRISRDLRKEKVSGIRTLLTSLAELTDALAKRSDIPDGAMDKANSVSSAIKARMDESDTRQKITLRNRLKTLIPINIKTGWYEWRVGRLGKKATNKKACMSDKSEGIERLEAGTKASARKEMEQLQHDIDVITDRQRKAREKSARLKLRKIAALALAAARLKDDKEATWKFIATNLLGLIDEYIADATEAGLIYFHYKTFKGVVDDDLEGAPKDAKGMIVSVLMAKWALANQKKYDADKFKKMNEDLDKMKDGTAEEALAKASAKRDIDEENARKDVDADQFKEVYIAILADTSLPEGYRKYIAGQAEEVLGGEKRDVAGMGAVVDAAMIDTNATNPLLAGLKRIAMKRTVIDPAKEAMVKAKGKTISITPQQADGYTDACVYSDDIDALADFLNKIPEDQKERIIGKIAGDINTGNIDERLQLLRALFDLTGKITQKLDIVKRLFDLAKDKKDKTLFEAAIELGQKFLKLDFSKDTKPLKDFVSYITNESYLFMGDGALERACAIMALFEKEIPGLSFNSMEAVIKALNENVGDMKTGVQRLPPPDDEKALIALHNLYAAIVSQKTRLDAGEKECGEDRNKLTKFMNETEGLREAIKRAEEILFGKEQAKTIVLGKDEPEYGAGSIKAILKDIRREAERAARQAYLEALKESAQLSRLNGKFEEAIKTCKEIIAKKREVGEIVNRGNGNDEFVKDVNDLVIRCYKSLGKKYEAHRYSAENVNRLQTKQGDELTAAEEALDRTIREKPSDAATRLAAAKARLTAYREARKAAAEARKKRDDRKKKKDDIENKQKDVEKNIELLRTKIEGVEKDREELKRQIGSFQKGSLQYFVARIKRRWLLPELRSFEHELADAEKKVKDLETEKKKLDDEISSAEKDLVKPEKKEDFEFRNVSRPIDFSGSQKDSLERAVDDAVNAIVLAAEKDDALFNEASDLLAELAESGENAPEKTQNVVSALDRAISGIEYRIKDPKLAHIALKRLWKTYIKIAEKILGRKELANALMANSSAETIDIQLSGVSATIDSFEILEHIAATEDAVSLNLLLAVAFVNSDNLLGFAARTHLVKRLYKLVPIAAEEEFPDDDAIIDVAAGKAAALAIAEEDKEKEEEKKEDKESPIAKANRIQEKKAAYKKDLEPIIQGMLAALRDAHTTAKPWEKMDGAAQKRMVAAVMSPTDNGRALISELGSREDAGQKLKNRADTMCADPKASRENLHEALRRYSQALEAGCDTAELHYNMARVYDTLGISSEAAGSYKKAIEKAGYDDWDMVRSATAALTRIYEISGDLAALLTFRETRAKACYARYETAKKDGRPQAEAVEALESAMESADMCLRIDPSDADAIVTKARALLAMAEYNVSVSGRKALWDEAKGLLDRVLYSRDVTWKTYLFYIVFRRAKMRAVSGAKEAEAEARRARAAVYSGLDMRKDARREADRLIKLGDKSAPILMAAAASVPEVDPVMKNVIPVALVLAINLGTLIILGHHYPHSLIIGAAYKIYAATIPWIIGGTVILSAAIDPRSVRLKEIRKYLEGAVVAEPANNKANNELYEILRKLKDYSAIAEQAKKEDAALKSDRSQKAKARREELKVLRAGAMLEAERRRIGVFGGNIGDALKARAALAEAEALLPPVGASVKEELDIHKGIEALRSKIINRQIWSMLLRYVLALVFVNRNKNMQRAAERRLEACRIEQDMAKSKHSLPDLQNVRDDIRNMIEAPWIGEEIKNQARKELSENLRLRGLETPDPGYSELLFFIALQYDPSNAAARLELGLKYAEKGLYTQAIKELKAALKGQLPEDKMRSGYDALALCMLYTGDAEGWLEASEKARGKWGIDTTTSVISDAVSREIDEKDRLEKIAEWARAIDEIKQLEGSPQLKRQGVLTEAINAQIARLRRFLPDNPVRDIINDRVAVGRLIFIAKKLAANKETDKAINILRAIEEAAVGYDEIKTRAQLELARIYEAIGETEEAFKAVRSAISNAPLSNVLPSDEKTALFLLGARLAAKIKGDISDETRVLNGFDDLKHIASNGWFFDADITNEWFAALAALEKSYRMWQEKNKKSGPEHNTKLTEKMLEVLSFIKNEWPYYTPVKSGDDLIKLTQIALSAGLLNITDLNAALDVILALSNDFISDSDRLKVIEMINDRVKKMISEGKTAGFDASAYREKLKSLRKRSVSPAIKKQFKKACKYGIGLTHFCQVHSFRAWRYLGRAGFKDAALRAPSAYADAEKCAGKASWFVIGRFFRSKAINSFTACAGVDYKKRDSLRRLARLQIMRKDYQKALSSAEEAAKLSKTDEEKADDRQLKADIYRAKINNWSVRSFSRNKKERALSLLSDTEAFFDTASGDIDPAFIAGVVKKISGAERILSRVYRGGIFARAWRLVRGRKAPQIPKEVMIRIYHLKGLCALSTEFTGFAKSYFNKMLSLNKSDGRALIGLRDCAVKEGDPELAIAYHEEALAARSPLASRPSEDMADIYREKTAGIIVRLPESRSLVILMPADCVARAMTLDPKNMEYEVLLAEEDFGAGDIDKAAEKLDSLRDKDEGAGFIELGNKAGSSVKAKAEALDARIRGRAGTVPEQVSGRKGMKGGVERYVRVALRLAAIERDVANIQHLQSKLAGVDFTKDQKAASAIKEDIISAMPANRRAAVRKEIGEAAPNKEKALLGDLLNERKSELEKAKQIIEAYLTNINVDADKTATAKRLMKIASNMMAASPLEALKLLERARSLSPSDDIDIAIANCQIAIARIQTDDKDWGRELKKAEDIFNGLNSSGKPISIILSAIFGLVNIEYIKAEHKISSDRKLSDDKIKQIEKARDDVVLLLNKQILNALKDITDIGEKAKIKVEFAAQLSEHFGRVLNILDARENVEDVFDRLADIGKACGIGAITAPINAEDRAIACLIVSRANSVLRDEELKKKIDWSTNGNLAKLADIIKVIAASADADIAKDAANFFFLSDCRYADVMKGISSRDFPTTGAVSIATIINEYLSREDTPIKADVLPGLKLFYEDLLSRLKKEPAEPDRAAFQTACYGLGLVNFRMGDYKAAAPYLRRAGSGLAARLYHVKARALSGRGPINSLVAKYVTFRMVLSNRHSALTTTAAKYSGLTVAASACTVILAGGIYAAIHWGLPIWADAVLGAVALAPFFLPARRITTSGVSFEALLLNDDDIVGDAFDEDNINIVYEGQTITVAREAVNAETVSRVKARLPSETVPIGGALFSIDRRICEALNNRFGAGTSRAIIDNAVQRAIVELHQARGAIDGRNIFVALLDSSAHLFEDCKSNDFIGINKHILKMMEGMSQDEAKDLLVLGLSHELYHEANPSAAEDEVIKFSRSVLERMSSDKQAKLLAALGAAIRRGSLTSLAPIPVPAPVAAEAAWAVVGVVGTDEEVLADYRNRYPDVRFVSVESGEAGIKALDERYPNVSIRAVVDISGDMQKTLAAVADKASIQAFLLRYPVIAALRDGNISRLGEEGLSKAFDIIMRSLPRAIPLNLDFILSGAADAEAARPVLPSEKPVSLNREALLQSFAGVPAVKPANYIPPEADPQDARAWVAAYETATRTGATAVDNMDYKFMDYIKGRSVAEIRAILNNYEVAAIENYWARPDKAKDFSGAMASEVDRLVAQNNGIAVAVFDEESLKLSEAARAEAARLAERFKDSNTFKVVMISREADKSPTEQALDKLRLPRGANVSCVHIFTSADPRTGSPDSAVIHNDIQRYADKGISYVVAKPGDRIDNAVQISMAGMLRSVKSGKPSFIALGDFPSMAFNDIMQLLHSIGGFFKIVRVSEAISEIFRAIRATAVSA